MNEFHHGDRVITRNKKYQKLEFGRVIHYTPYSSPPPPSTSPSSSKPFSLFKCLLSSYFDPDDFLDNERYRGSSGSTKSFTSALTPPPSKKNIIINTANQLVSPMCTGTSSNNNQEQEQIKKKIVWDNNRGEMELPDGYCFNNVFKVVDRKFSVGQSVTMMSNSNIGQRGKVVDVMPLASVKIVLPKDYAGCIVQDVPLRCINPISPIFSGVTIAYSNYVGQVLDVQRRTTYRLSDGSSVMKITTDSVLVKESCVEGNHKSQPKPLPVQKLFAYPYSSNLSGVPYLGKSECFSRAYVRQLREELEMDKENNNVGSNTALNVPSIKQTRKRTHEFLEAKVEDVEIVSIKVQWTGMLPQHLHVHLSKHPSSSKTLLPPTHLTNSTQLHQVLPLYVPSSVYFDKHAGLCLCTLNDHNALIMPEPTWSSHFFNNIHAEEEPKQNSESEEALSKTFLATKHFVRHKYHVIWDQATANNQRKKESGVYFGSELTPNPAQEHMICLGQIHSHVYVLPKGNDLSQSWDYYGVVVEKINEHSIVVEWLKVNHSDGSVKTDRILKCNLIDVVKHPTFNELHEGRVVVKSNVATTKGWGGGCENFRIGTVVSVKRFAVGQVLVHSPTTNSILELWPHMLEPFIGFTLQELNELKSTTSSSSSSSSASLLTEITSSIPIPVPNNN